MTGTTSLRGSVKVQVLRPCIPQKPLSLREIFVHGFPRPRLPATVLKWRLKNCWRLIIPMLKIAIAKALKISFIQGQLSLVVLRRTGEIEPLGLASLRVVTNAGVNYIVDAFQNLVELENFKYHGIGTGTTEESASDTALVSELSTQYDPDNTRATGSLTEGSSANIFRTVGTNTVDAAVAITEHGIFTQAATGGGTLLDRSVFSVVNLAAGDSLQTTYDLTVQAGG